MNGQLVPLVKWVESGSAPKVHWQETQRERGPPPVPLPTAAEMWLMFIIGCTTKVNGHDETVHYCFPNCEKRGMQFIGRAHLGFLVNPQMGFPFVDPRAQYYWHGHPSYFGPEPPAGFDLTANLLVMSPGVARRKLLAAPCGDDAVLQNPDDAEAARLHEEPEQQVLEDPVVGADLLEEDSDMFDMDFDAPLPPPCLQFPSLTLDGGMTDAMSLHETHQFQLLTQEELDQRISSISFEEIINTPIGDAFPDGINPGFFRGPPSPVFGGSRRAFDLSLDNDEECEYPDGTGYIDPSLL